MTIEDLWRYARWLAGAMVACALAALAGWLGAIRWAPDAKAYPVQGVDVAETSGAIDWFALKGAGAQFAYVRASTGGQRDPSFEENWSGVKAAGLGRGALHRWSLCVPPGDQARAFVTTVPREADMLPAAVELGFDESCSARPDRDRLLDQLRRFLTAVETHTGKPMLLKVTRGFEAKYQVAEALPRNVWVTQFFLAPAYAPRPWKLWQANAYRRLDGAEGPVNWDVVAP